MSGLSEKSTTPVPVMGSSLLRAHAQFAADTPAPNPTSNESANLDLLRALAVLFVFVLHVLLFVDGARSPSHGLPAQRYWSNLGHWGVLMFFVHTGVVLMRSLERLDRGASSKSLSIAFMVRRGFRLLPLSSLTVLIIAFFRLPVGHLQDGHFWPVPMRPVDVLSNLLLVQNLVGVESLEAPLWSLPLELHMYLALPLIYRFTAQGRGAGRTVLLWSVAATLDLLLWRGQPSLQLLHYAPCFLAGVLAFRLPAQFKRWNHALWPFAILATTVVYLRTGSFLAGWAGCAALGVLYSQVAEMPDGWVRRACKYVAKYSYGIYLSHFILIWLAFAKWQTQPIAVRIAIFGVLAAAVPVLLYHLVEEPMIRTGSAVSSRLDPRWDQLGFGRFALVPRPRHPFRVVLLVTVSASVAVVGMRHWAAKSPYALHLTANSGSLAAAPVHLVGRFDLRDPAGPRFAWSGSAIEVNFVGTGIELLLADQGHNFYSISIDGRAATRLSTIHGKHSYLVADKLTRGVHRVVLTKLTESMVGVAQYLGLKVYGGDVIAAKPTRVHQIEYIGDSVACGYGILSESSACEFSPQTEAADSSYATLAAHALGAQATLIAYAGKGIYRDYLGATRDQMPALYFRTLPDDPSSQWRFNGPEPEAVVVDLGTNDFYLGDPGPAFGKAYVEFLRELRARRPHASILCAVSSMLLDGDRPGVRGRAVARAAIAAAVQTLRDAGDARVLFVDFDEQDPRNGYGCEDHPSAKTHRVMAEKLVPVLRAAIAPENVVSSLSLPANR